MINTIRVSLLIIIGRTISFLSQTLNLGHGSTWPGHIALYFYPDILFYFSKQIKDKIILIAGTNGKTTTSKMIQTVLEKKGKKVIHNESGANLLNGLVSAFILKSNLLGKIEADDAIFEVDEATLPIVIDNLASFWGAERLQNRFWTSPSTPSLSTPSSGPRGSGPRGQNDGINSNKKLIVVLLNLFRDQLDRYGEVDIIARKWNEVLETLSPNTTLILNADDPQIAELGISKKAKVFYFGLEDEKLFLEKTEDATDSTFCLRCGAKLIYDGVFYSHLGHWHCPSCGRKRPATNLSSWQELLPGVYNRYNTLAAVLTLLHLGLLEKEIKEYLNDFKPAFGRQEEFIIALKKVRIFLSKNPAGFNESLRTVINEGAREILFVLNDRIPDGRDVSWIWDVDFEMLHAGVDLFVSGDRAYDMAVRLKYSGERQKSRLRQDFGGQAKVKSQKHKSKVKSRNETIKQSNNFIVEESLEKAIKIGLEQLPEKETLYILPTYSAMLEVRKILIGKKIL
ncbi:DUF1727 domain-containing protein [Candidatus Gottesmanbacteria bacterium]|nr:DUF1727 domain-containing protein [Candidatus Gottesmanbacteria bacterium]